MLVEVAPCNDRVVTPSAVNANAFIIFFFTSGDVACGGTFMFSDPGDDHLRISNKSINREYFSFAGRLGYDRVDWKHN